MTEATIETKVSLAQRVRDFSARLLTDDEVLAKSVVVLYDRQTSDERTHRTTKHANKVGVSRAHGVHFVRIGEAVKTGNGLANEDITFLRGPGPNAVPRISLYAEQLVRANVDRSI